MKVQALLLHEFGKDGVSMLKNRIAEKAKVEQKIDKHAMPPIVNSGGGATMKAPSSVDVQAEGNWAALGSAEDFRKNVFKQG